MAGALALMFLMLSFEVGGDLFAYAWLNIIHTSIIALLMVSRLPTYSLKSISIRHDMAVPVMVGVVGLFALLIVEPWLTLVLIGIGYLATIPFSIRTYRRMVAEEGKEG